MKTKNFLAINNLHSAELFEGFTMTSQEIEDFVSDQPLDVMKKPNVFFVERKMRLPMFAADFYHFIYSKKKVPTQQEFIDYYKESNKDYLTKVITNDDFEQGLYGRLCRTYPSLVRDIHFLRKIEESGRFDKVDYNLEVDLFGKADILVEKGGKWYGVKLRTKTRRSDAFAAIKEGGGRGNVDLGYEPVELAIDLDKAYSLNTQKDSIKLYHESSINELDESIRQNLGG